jgi:hypothetical protein
MIIASIKRAGRDAFSWFGGWQAVVPIILVAPVGLVLYWRFGPEAEVQNQVVAWLITGLAAGLVVFSGFFFWALLAAPYRMEREAHETTLEKLSRLRSQSEGLSERSLERIKQAKYFELWEIACLITGDDFHRPVRPGHTFMEQEQLKRDFLTGKLPLIEGDRVKQSYRVYEMFKTFNRQEAHEPFKNSDGEQVLRNDLVAYLKKRKIEVSGLTD